VRTSTLLSSLLALAGLALTANGARAQAPATWWPFKVIDMDSGNPKPVDYTPPMKASKPWKICVLFPHMKDTFWVAVDYGIAQEAERLGVSMTLYQAGGYENLSTQLSQFDDCMAGDFDAIVVGPISEAGLARKFRQGMKAGKVIISTANPVPHSNITSKMFVDFNAMGAQTGGFLVSYLAGKPASVGAFPGPAGSGWAEGFLGGFKSALAGHANADLVTTQFGDSGVAVQLGLIQNAMQAYPKLDVIWGTAPTAEAAIGAVSEAKRSDILILSSYEDQAMLDALKKHEIIGFATQYPVVEGRMAIDTAVQALEKQPVMKYIEPIPEMVDTQNISTINMTNVLAPTSFQAVYHVTPK
jgi:protein TorT